MFNLHIAVVEDDADDREFITSALRKYSDNLRISVFRSGSDFMHELNSHVCVPDLIVTDLRMPLMSGFEVINEVKQNMETRTIPVVVLSTSGNEEDINKAKKLGASGYYIKPFSIEEYFEITSNIISSFNKNALTFAYNVFLKFWSKNPKLLAFGN
jgi:CheY-like chemotaxis protein